eukprot:COSAG02_NODE_639_length_19078_cov_9.380262_4_plen_63_part_00
MKCRAAPLSRAHNEQLGLLEGTAEELVEETVAETIEDAAESISTRILVSGGSQQDLGDAVRP